MKNKRFVTILLTMLIAIVGIMLYTDIMSSISRANNITGFRVISREKNIDGEVIQEVVDEDSGVHYYVNMTYQQGSMCPVHNSDGTIKVDKEK